MPDIMPIRGMRNEISIRPIKTDKTITVLIESYKVHPLYGKRVKYSKKYAAHDELNEAKVGDLVRIEECRPM